MRLCFQFYETLLFIIVIQNVYIGSRWLYKALHSKTRHLVIQKQRKDED